MSPWKGFNDNHDNHDQLPSPSPPSNPFSAAFRAPRPPGIQTGIRDVPPSVSQHPEDLYDALEVEFNKAMIHNPNRRNKSRLTFEARRHMIRHLTMTETTWKDLPSSNKGSQERNRRQKALKYFEIKGPLLIRKPEILTEGAGHKIALPLRQAALDENIYYIIKSVYERLRHADYKKPFEIMRQDVYGINREEVEWFTDYCRSCEINRPNHTRAPL
jgi:hypothetical protein